MLNRLRLSEIGGERLLVCCDACGLVSNLSVSALMGSYGDIPMDQLKAELFQRCSGASIHEKSRECGMYVRNVEHQTAA
jgi:hypothetical protein